MNATEVVTVDREACILSGRDFDEIVEALGEQQEAIIWLLAAVGAREKGLSTDSLQECEELARLSSAVLSITNLINHPNGQRGGAS